MRPPTSRPELTPIVSLPSLYNPRDLALIRRTVASDTTDDEFALFIHWARSLRLDPLRRQVHAFVFHKQDPKKRRLSLVTSIEGFRAIAARTGNYRPDENEPAFIIDDAIKSDTNPAGLVSCSVRVWQSACAAGILGTRPRRCPRRQTRTREGVGPGRQADDITRPSERHGDSVNENAQHETPHVGIFWVVQATEDEARLLAASCPLD
jgi:phage recombination protein Bet